MHCAAENFASFVLRAEPERYVGYMDVPGHLVRRFHEQEPGNPMHGYPCRGEHKPHLLTKEDFENHHLLGQTAGHLCKTECKMRCAGRGEYFSHLYIHPCHYSNIRQLCLLFGCILLDCVDPHTEYYGEQLLHVQRSAEGMHSYVRITCHMGKKGLTCLHQAGVAIA